VRGREEVEMVIRERSRMQESCFFRDGILKFVLRWKKCIINVLVAYAEKKVTGWNELTAFNLLAPEFYIKFEQITNLKQQFFSLLC
jgi:hypothetical protein